MNRFVYTFNKQLGGMQASAKIARYIAKIADLDIVTASDPVDEFDTIDLMIIVNGAFQYAGNKGLAKLGVAIEKAKRIVWVQNDYTIRPPKHVGTAESPFRVAFRNRYSNNMEAVHFWSTIPEMLPTFGSSNRESKMGYYCGEFSDYVNWNALSMAIVEAEGVPKPRDVSGTTKDSLIYYGAYRRERERHFDQWFDKPPVDVFISTQQVAKFLDRYEDALVMDTVDNLHVFLRSCGAMGLYLEDGRSHRQFHSPANRFYEMLAARMPIVFDSSCWSTFRQAGYSITDFHTDKPANVVDMIKRAGEIAEEQHERWWKKAMEDYDRIFPQVSELLEKVAQ